MSIIIKLKNTISFLSWNTGTGNIFLQHRFSFSFPYFINTKSLHSRFQKKFDSNKLIIIRAT